MKEEMTGKTRASLPSHHYAKESGPIHRLRSGETTGGGGHPPPPPPSYAHVHATDTRGRGKRETPLSLFLSLSTPLSLSFLPGFNDPTPLALSAGRR